MKNTTKISDIARLIDVSAVRANVTINELEELALFAKKHNFICAFTMPYLTHTLFELLKDSSVNLGGVVGFPSGADTTNIKIATAKEMISVGCDELDMVCNVGALISKDYNLFKNDIKAIVETSNGLPVKSILEIAYLTDYEIQKGSELAVKAGVTYVKTGTGWANKPTTVDTIKLIKSTIGNSAKIKAAGGVRDLNTLLAMIDAGCDRFGISVSSMKNILLECDE